MMKYQDKTKAKIIIKYIGYIIFFTFLMYLVCCFAFAMIMAFLKKSGWISYIEIDGFYRAANESNVELIDFYNIFNTARWTYLGLFKEYPITTGLVSSIIILTVIWMCSTSDADALGEIMGEKNEQAYKEETKTKGMPEGQVTQYDSSYINYIDKIANEVNNLKVMWDNSYLDSNSFKNWYKNFRALENEFRDRYTVSDKASWIFLELSQLESSLDDIEKTQKTYQKYIQEDAPSDLVESIKILLKQHENLVAQIVTQAIAYCKMLREEI